MNAPTCPVCSTNERVEPHRGHHLCTTCWTVFCGSQSEWESSKSLRDFRSKLVLQMTRTDA